MNDASKADLAERAEAQAILKSIGTYAAAYSDLQSWQDKSTLIQKGDQKTGSIGEFYATLYLKAKYPDAVMSSGHHSEKGWDIEVRRGKRTWRVQVKTVSAFAEKRRLSPLHEGWDELFVFYLGRDFRPLGFWVIADNAIMLEKSIRKGCSCPKPGVPSTGSRAINFGDNRVEELRSLTGKFIQL